MKKINWSFLGALLTALAIILGAFGAHGLEKALEAKYLKTFKTGVDYHLIHALALTALGQFKLKSYSPLICLLLGMILFSGFCYLYAVTQIKTFAMIVPFGGISFIIGWFWLAKGFLRN